jgi:hypothetical protein
MDSFDPEPQIMLEMIEPAIVFMKKLYPTEWGSKWGISLRF